jgi:uncharacterized protein (TIGR04255 family)
MSDQLNRPPGLPEFSTPPLNEVVLGVQFAPARGYQQIMAGEVWSLFRSDFPVAEEYPPLLPTFETFGPSAVSAPFPLGVIAGAQHNRFWFLSIERDQLIQFQQDRLLHNWRKVGSGNNPYPRFEAMSRLFEAEVNKLEDYFNSLQSQSLICNQVEITYINTIVAETKNAEAVSALVNFVNLRHLLPDDFSVSLRDTIIGPSKIPLGRLYCDLSSAPSHDDSAAFFLRLTVRGAPYSSSKEAAFEFLHMAHEILVKKFASITTKHAHALWGRTQ